MPYLVDFEPLGRRGACREDESLLDAARALGVDLASVCGGAGTCGRCQVQIVEGQVDHLGAARRGLTERVVRNGCLLACRTIPRSDLRVYVPPESLTALQRTQVEGLKVLTEVKPAVTQCLVRLEQPTLEDGRGDDQRLVEAVTQTTGIPAALPDLEVTRSASTLLRQLGWQARVTVFGRDIIHVGPVAVPWLGVAVDLGTTKIAVYIVDLSSGNTLVSRGAMNAQIAYGEDVISRLTYAAKGPEEAERLQSLLVGSLNQLVASACEEIQASPAQIVDAVVVGNTAMHHLFLRLPTTQLATAPYVPSVQRAVDTRAREVGLALAPGARLHLLPNIAGFVGADHVAVLLATNIADRSDKVLVIDIGTNTEMCLAADGRLTSLSCASGPAFEGAHIKFGMRAAPGAIEHVRIVDGRVEYKTIGDAVPVGFCGSGILDVVAQLRQAGIVNKSGRLEGAGVRMANNDREFVIARGADDSGSDAIVVTQHDIREVQLAKGAIRCGIDTLLQETDLSAEDLDEVIIAGAFGTYIDVQSAITIGMLPAVPLDRVSQVGNAAGAGARLALISQPMRDKAAHISAGVRYLELACHPRFTRNYAEALFLDACLNQNRR